MKIDTNILLYGHDVIPYEDFEELAVVVTTFYQSSSEVFWMWKMLQIGFVYGKQAERTRRKKNQ